MFGADKGEAKAQVMDGRKLYIGVVQARFNEDVTNALWSACQAQL